MDLMPRQDPPQPVGRRALMRVVWRYGDGTYETARVIRNSQATYNVLVRVDAVRWRVLAGTWGLQLMAFQAACAAHFRHMNTTGANHGHEHPPLGH